MRVVTVRDEATPALRRLQALIDDLTPAMQEIGEVLIASTKERFVSGTAPDGTPWAPKTPATIAAYRRRGDTVSTRPLIGPTGRLGREITATSSSRSVEVGSNLIQSAVMQFGAAKGAFGRTSRGAFGTSEVGDPIPWGNIPARPFLGVSDQDERNILDIVEEHLQGAWSGD